MTVYGAFPWRVTCWRCSRDKRPQPKSSSCRADSAKRDRPLPRIQARMARMIAMRLPILLAALAVAALGPLSGSAVAGDLTVVVRDAAGQPVKDAVAMLRTGAPPSQPIKFSWPYSVSQH